MHRRSLTAALIVAICACSPAPQRPSEAPAPDAPTEIACNTLTPDTARQVAITDPVAAAASADLRGGRINPGVYDLVSAQRDGAATGWTGTRAIVVEVSEDTSSSVVTLNWAGTTPRNVMDRWTATLSETPSPRLAYTCGRIGEIEAGFAANEASLQLRLADGANGALVLTFVRR